MGGEGFNNRPVVDSTRRHRRQPASGQEGDGWRSAEVLDFTLTIFAEMRRGREGSRLNLVFFEFTIERGAIDTEQLRRFGFIALSRL